jgi:hypothetical protein
MSIATDILNLRRNQSSSVSTLIAMIDWQKSAQDQDHKMSRGFAVAEAADDVLMNVAVYAAEALNEPPLTHKTRRALSISRRKPRQSDPGRLHQRRLYYLAQ